MTGTLRGSGSDLELELSDPRLLGGSGTATARAVAAQLADHGIRLTVTTDRPLVTLGVARTGFWQRRVTGSPHIAVRSVGAALRILGLRSASDAASLVPPPTPLPLLPTILRRPRHPTTTHDPDGGGYPRLVMAPGPHPHPGDRQPVFHLGALSVLGSDPEVDIVLPGLSARHAVVRHTEDDEFEITSLDPDAPVLRQRRARARARRCCAPAPGSRSAAGRCRSTARSGPTTAARTADASAVSSAASVCSRSARSSGGPSR